MKALDACTKPDPVSVLSYLHLSRVDEAHTRAACNTLTLSTSHSSSYMYREYKSRLFVVSPAGAMTVLDIKSEMT